jgi:hypothetical protein
VLKFKVMVAAEVGALVGAGAEVAGLDVAGAAEEVVAGAAVVVGTGAAEVAGAVVFGAEDVGAGGVGVEEHAVMIRAQAKTSDTMRTSNFFIFPPFSIIL